MGPCDAIVIRTGCELAGDALGGAVRSAAESTFASVARAMAEAGEAVLREVTTAWTRIPSGSMTNIEAIGLLQGDLKVVTALVAVLALIVAAAKMALTRRGDDMRDAVGGLVRVLVVGAAGITALTLALEAGDLFAAWALNRAAPNGQFNPTVGLATGALGTGLMFILGLLAIVTGIIQIALLLVRSSLIVVLAGSWQLAAAASTTAAGAQMWKKVTGWLVAFVLYKPVAAICYAAAFRLLAGGQGPEAAPSLLSTIEGMLLLVLAIVALPAMLRLVVPAVSAMGMGGSTAGAVAGTAAVATGAVALAGAGAAGGGLGGRFGGGGGGFGAASGNGPSGGSSAAPGAVGPGSGSPPGLSGPSGGGGATGGSGPSGSRGGAGPGGAHGEGPAPANSSADAGAPTPSGASGDSGRITPSPPGRGSSGAVRGLVAGGAGAVDRRIDNVMEGRQEDG